MGVPLKFLRLFFYRRFALNAFVMERYDVALRYFEKVAALCPGEPGVHYNMGVCQMGLKYFDASEASFLEELHRNGRTWDRCKALGDLHYLWGNRTSALAWYEGCRKLATLGHGGNWLDRRIALLESEQSMTRVMASMRLLEEGLAAMAEKDHGKAEAAFEAAMENDPTNIQALNNLGVLRMDQHRDPKGAADCFRRAVALYDAPVYAINLKKALKELEEITP